MCLHCLWLSPIIVDRDGHKPKLKSKSDFAWCCAGTRHLVWGPWANVRALCIPWTISNLLLIQFECLPAPMRLHHFQVALVATPSSLGGISGSGVWSQAKLGFLSLCPSLTVYKFVHKPEQAPRKHDLPMKSSLTVCLHCSIFGPWKCSSTIHLWTQNLISLHGLTLWRGWRWTCLISSIQQARRQRHPCCFDITTLPRIVWMSM